MKKEWILSDAEKKQKRAKIEENRAKKRTEPGTSSLADLESQDDVSNPSPAMFDASLASPSVAERPQARVLPSTRSADEPPRQKVK